MDPMDTGMTRSEGAKAAADAKRSGHVDAAAALYRRLVASEPENVAWRLRLADALALAGWTDDALGLRQAIASWAAATGRPLVALIATLPDGSAAHLVSPHLKGSPRLGSVLRSAPPVLQKDGPLPHLDPEAALPELPSRPAREPQAPIPLLWPMPLLSALDLAQVQALVPHLSRRSLEAGEILLAEGETADALYLVAHGVFDVQKNDPDRPTVSLSRLSENGLLGEMALVLSRPRTATVRALTEAEVLRIDLVGLTTLAAATPEVRKVLEDFTRQRVLQMLAATSPLFRDLEPSARAALLKVFTVREIPSGALITRQGGEGKALRVVVSGRVEVLRAEADEPPARIAGLGPGEVFGEIALLSGNPATATVLATEPTVVLELLREQVDAVRQTHPTVDACLQRLSESRLAEHRFIFADDDFIEEADETSDDDEAAVSVLDLD